MWLYCRSRIVRLSCIFVYMYIASHTVGSTLHIPIYIHGRIFIITMLNAHVCFCGRVSCRCVCVCGIGAHNNRLSQFPRNLESGRQGCRATVVIPGAPRTSTNGHCYVYVVYFFGVVQRNLATFCTFIHPICECTFRRWAIVPAGERHSGAIYTRIQGKIWNKKEEEDKKKSETKSYSKGST